MFFFIPFLLSSLALEARYLPLPSSFGSRAIYHVEAHQINTWSCGYNALFNACNLEHFLGVSNKYRDFAKFSQLCTAFLQRVSKKKRDGISNVEIEGLALSLGLGKVYYLSPDQKGEVVPLLESSTFITVPASMSSAQANRLLEQAVKKREQALYSAIHQKLKVQKDVCVHFVCHVRARREDHCILLSLVQKKGKDRALYIFDNLNGKVTDRSYIKPYIDFISKTFQVSSEQAYRKHKISIPDRWPTSPYPPAGYYYRYG
jgi:hypothetical protein